MFELLKNQHSMPTTAMNKFSNLLLVPCVAFLAPFADATAQTLNQQIARGVTFNAPQPDYQGIAALMNARTQAEQAQVQRRQIDEQAATQRRLIEEQTRALQLENNQREAAARRPERSEVVQEMSPYMQQWLKSAQPRMHLFPDFEKVVFAPDLAISEDMIKLMAASPYAADIAYYLGSHKMEAVAIRDMPMLDAARSISEIEKRQMGASKGKK